MNGWAMLAAIARPDPPDPAGRVRHGWAATPPAGTLDSFVAEPFPYDSDGAAISYDTARTVPAFVRGMDVIGGTVSTLPLVEYDATGERVGVFDFAPAVKRQLAEDLVCYGRAGLQVSAVSAVYGDTRPSVFRPITMAEVSRITATHVTIGDRVFPRLDELPLGADSVGAVVVFDYSRGGALTDGARLLLTARALEDAARRYANEPAPHMVLRNNGADLPAEKVRELLDGMADARKRHAIAYVNSLVDLDSFGFDPSALQLVEARQHTALEVSRLLNLDPVWLGASVSGQSLTYTNRQDLYRQLVDLTLQPLLSVLEDRLSRRDVLPGGRRVRFALDAFLRGNPNERMTVWRDLIDLGLATAADIARVEPLAADSATPRDIG